MEEEKDITILIDIPSDLYKKLAEKVGSPLVTPKMIGAEIIAELRRSLMLRKLKEK